MAEWLTLRCLEREVTDSIPVIGRPAGYFKKGFHGFLSSRADESDFSDIRPSPYDPDPWYSNFRNTDQEVHRGGSGRAREIHKENEQNSTVAFVVDATSNELRRVPDAE